MSCVRLVSAGDVIAQTGAQASQGSKGRGMDVEPEGRGDAMEWSRDRWTFLVVSGYDGRSLRTEYAICFCSS